MTATDPERHGLSVVVPAYDESARLPGTLAAMTARMDEVVGPNWEILVADDGSTDATVDLATDAGRDEPRVQVITAERHRGKGAALHAGFAAARYDLVIFVDADLPVPVDTFGDLVALADGADIIAGTRVGASVVRAQPLARRLGGRLFRTAVACLGLRTTSDPQCGVKLLRRSTCGTVVAAVQSEGFGFDVELLRRATTAGLTVVEAPVEWSHVSGSSIRPVRDALRTLGELAAVRRLLR